jgi:DNA-binding SARP family transcriptional activator/WD40 repeat protein
VEFRVLGPFEADHQGQPLDLGPHKQRSLLALLLIHANRVVSTDRILDELWGEDAEGKENALWVYVSRLRAILEPEREKRGESTVLLRREHGYELSADPDSIDAHRFEEAVAKGHSLIRDDAAAASGILVEALGLWRGAALEDFAYDGFAQTEITRLEELRLAAIGDRIEADLRRGQAGELVGELEALQQQHPMQERFVGHLILALYRSGRQADALRTFERFRRHIGEELGIEPSPELRRLEEQVLLHDSRIQARDPVAKREAGGEAGSVVNPFKGLRPFHEDDSSDFFGRDRLVADVVSRLDQGERLIGLVGPSGSGKSSLVRAGLIPALRKGAATGSDEWLFAQMVPGAHPFAELEAALLRSSLDAPDSLTEQLADPETGILRAVLRVLPSDTSRLLLVIDQLDELFTLVEDEDQRARFLAGLLPALEDPHGRVMVVLTLRADFYDRPLAYPEFGSRLGDGVVNVVALTPDELEEAARGPAERAGVSFEPALLAALLTDVAGQPGALPLFQYTLTELFDRRVGDTLTSDSYSAVGGVRGALTRRADDLYARLDPDQQAAAKQLFLRMVTIADSDEWGRRIPASEILSLDVDVVALQGVIEVFGAHRLLTLDRDYVTGSPTVEVAHEALLREWSRLRTWVDDARTGLRERRRVAAAAREWVEAGEQPDFLLTGMRLAPIVSWSEETDLALTDTERRFLAASLDAEQSARDAKSRRRRVLAGISAVVGLVVVVLVVFGLTARSGTQRLAEIRRLDRLTEAARDVLDRDPNLSLLLAIEAAEGTEAIGLDVSPETIEVLHEGLRRQRLRFEVPSTDQAGLGPMAMTPDGSTVAVGAPGGGVRLYDVADGAEMLALPTEQPVRTLDIDPSGALLAGRIPDGIILWDLERSAEPVRLALGACLPGLDIVKFSHDSSFVAALCGSTVSVVELPNNVLRWEQFVTTPTDMALSPDGRFVAVQSDGSPIPAGGLPPNVVVFDTSTEGRAAAHIELTEDVASVGWLADGSELLIGLVTGPIVHVATDDWSEVGRDLDLTKGPTVLAMSADGTVMAFDEASGTVAVKDLATGRIRTRLPDQFGAVRSIAISFSGDIVAIHSGDSVGVHDIGPESSRDVVTIAGMETAVEDAALAPDASFVVGLEDSGRLHVWHMPSGVEQWSDSIDLSTYLRRLRKRFVGKPVDLSPDGTRLVVVGDGTRVRMWDAGSGALTHEIDLLTELTKTRAPEVSILASAVAFSPSGDRIGVAGDGWIVLLNGDLVFDRLLKEFNVNSEIYKIDFDDVMTKIAEQSFADVEVWSLSDGLRLNRAPMGGSGPASFDMSGDGNLLVTVNESSVVTVTETTKSEELRRIDTGLGAGLDVAFSPDETLLAVAFSETEVPIFDTETMEQLYTLRGHSLPVTSVSWSADGGYLATSSADGTIRVYAMDPDLLLDIARERVTRQLSDEECIRYLDADRCEAPPSA